MINILVVEDDVRVADFLDRGLRAEGYRVQVARNGPDGLRMAQVLAKQSIEQNETSIVLMDVMLPGMNGLDVCQQLRATGVALPIMMLTAMGTLEDRVTGLKLGANDYLAKPFAFEELLARIEALARRAKDFRTSAPSKLTVADLVLDLDSMRVTRNGHLIALTSKELAVLELLMSAPGRLYSRERILANVWSINEDPLTNIVDVYIRRLRSKVDAGHSNSLIHTQRGLGYRLEDTLKQQ